MTDERSEKISENLIEVDARRLLCPMPVIRAQQATVNCDAGQRIRVTANDPGVLHDIPAWVKVHQHELVDKGQDGNEYWVEFIVNKQ